MKKRFRGILVVLGFAITCFSAVSCEKPIVFEDEDLINSLYQKAEDTLTFKNSEYILETYLYRNLMPGGPIPEKRLLISILYLTNIDSLDIAEELKLDKVYVINRNLIYKSTPVYRADNSLPNYKQSYICREGPEWETDIKVNVVIWIINQSTNEDSYLIARNQTIKKEW